MEESFPRGKAHVAAAGAPTAAGDKRRRSESAGRAPDRLFGTSVKRDSHTHERDEKKGGRGRRAESKGPSSRSASAHKGRELIGSALKSSGEHAHGRAEELTAKRLKVGTKVLARVKRCTRTQLVLALAHGLTAYADVRDINPILHALLRPRRGRTAGRDTEDGHSDDEADSDAADDAADADMDEDAESGRARSVKLSDFFVPGQYVLGTVIRVGDDSFASQAANPALALARSLQASADTSSASRRNIMVSLSPDTLNAELAASQLRMGSLIYGYVRSVEDHGFVVHTGVEGLNAFLPFTAADGTTGQAGTNLRRDVAGSPVLATISHINRAASTATLGVSASTIAESVSREATHTIMSLLPGSAVQATIDRVLPNGLAVTFLAFFHATIHMDHLPQPSDALWAQNAAFKPGSTLKCRVLYINAGEKVIALSAAPHIVSLGVTTPEPVFELGIGGPTFSVGDGGVVDHATVLRVDPDHGLLIGWNRSMQATEPSKGKVALEEKLRRAREWGCTAYVHISRVSDEKVAQLERAYQPGAEVRARLLGFQGMEGCAMATMKSSIVDASVLRPSDVKVGDVLKGRVLEISLEKRAEREHGRNIEVEPHMIAALVQLGEGVRGAIPVAHLADVLPKRSLASAKSRAALFKGLGITPGAPIAVRVFAVNDVTGRITLTLKQTLMDSDLPVLPTFDAISRAFAHYRLSGGPVVRVHASIVAIRDTGLVVAAFGDVRGLVSVEDLVAAGVLPVEKVITRVVEGRDASHGGKPRSVVPVEVLEELYQVGQVIKVTVSAVLSRARRVQFSLGTTEPPRASAHSAVPAEDASTGAAASQDVSAGGVEPQMGDIVDAVVTGVDTSRSAFACDLRALRRVAEDDTHESLSPTTAVRAELLFAHCEDSGDVAQGATAYKVGDTINDAVVLRVTRSASGVVRAMLSRKPTLHAVASSSALRHMMPSQVDTLRAGALLVGYIASVTSFGAFVRCLGDVTGLAPRAKWASASAGKPRDYAPHDVVLAVVESVKIDVEDAGSGGKYRVTLSLQPDAIARAGAADLLLQTALPPRASADEAPRSLAGVPLYNRLRARECNLRDDQLSLRKVQVGAVYDAVVRTASRAGLLLDVSIPGHDSLPGFAMPPATAEFAAGSTIAVRCADVDVTKGVVLMVVEQPGAAEPLAEGGGAASVAKRPRGDGESMAEAELSLGAILRAEVVLYKPGAHHAIVRLRDCAGLLLFADVHDFITGASADLSVGTAVEVVVTQLPARRPALAEQSRSGKKKKAKPTAVSGTAPSAEQALEQLALCTVAPSMLSVARADRVRGAGAAAASSAARKISRRADTVDVGSLIPGMTVVAVLRIDRRLRAAGPHGDSSDEDADDSDGGAVPEDASLSTGRPLPPLRFKLLGVAGSYVAELSPAECVALCPYTGERGEDGHADALHRYRSLAASKSSAQVKAKIVAVVREQRPGSRKAGELWHRVELTVRPDDLAAPEQHIASERPEWVAYAADEDADRTQSARVASASNVIAAAPAVIAAAGPSELLAPALWSPGQMPLVAGATTYAVVEGHSPHGVWVGLGGGVHGRVPLLECGDDDGVRDGHSGALIVDAGVAARLSAARVSDLHALGMIVPVLITHVDREKRHVVASIRRAPAARKVAADALSRVVASRSAKPVSAKKGKTQRPGEAAALSAPLSASDAFAAATAAVVEWATAADADVCRSGSAVLVCARPDVVRGGGPQVTLAMELPQVRPRFARLDIAHASDRLAWKSQPLRGLTAGTVVVAALLPPRSDTGGADEAGGDKEATRVSLRKSMLELAAPGSKSAAAAEAMAAAERAEAERACVPGAVVSGFVVGVSRKRADVRLAPGVTAAVPASRLSDRHGGDLTRTLAAGKLVTGVVLPKAEADAAGVALLLSLRPKDVEARSAQAAGPRLITWAGLHAGQAFDAVVTTVADFGVFVALEGTSKHGSGRADSDVTPPRISGLCHVSEISDDEPVAALRGTLAQKFSPGDRVRVIVVEADAKNQKMSLSMRPSRFAALEEVDAGSDSEVDAIATAVHAHPPAKGRRAESDDEEDSNASEDSSENLPAQADASAPGARGRVGGVYSHLADDDDDAAPTGVSSTASNGKMHAAAGAAARAPRFVEADELLSDASVADDDEGAIDGTAGAAGDAKLSRAAQKAARKRAQREAEEETRKLEMRLATGEAERNPETAEDFERLVAASPNDSQAWIRYMAWLLSITEVTRARDIAKRALHTVNFRLEDEKLNVWTALINLEMSYGDTRSLAKVFAEAQAAVDPLRVHLAMLQAYQRAGAARSAECEALFGVAAKKFGRTFMKLWPQWAACRFRNGDADGARGLLQRALTVLPKIEHVTAILQFALLEYRFAFADSAVGFVKSSERSVARE